MIRLTSLAAALATSVTLLSAIPSHAQRAGYYAATPITPPSKVGIITDGTMWKCLDGMCVANKAPVRDMIMCQLVVQRVGKLSVFSANGAAFDADALARCNARAR